MCSQQLFPVARQMSQKLLCKGRDRFVQRHNLPSYYITRRAKTKPWRIGHFALDKGRRWGGRQKALFKNSRYLLHQLYTSGDSKMRSLPIWEGERGQHRVLPLWETW